ncbi:FK506-binding protein 5 [Lucilia sericata]|uniref:FK506-binding protein 5 n=1 Tax=Lucilia sericata TaxID=13632 RepID=UPI0018A834F5|nr:FK506-binding protein 5 [Lucilia sericata]
MTSQMEVAMQPPAAVKTSNDVNLSTQLSILNDSGDSSNSTSTQPPLLFTCQTIKSNGNLLFPLGENYENKKQKLTTWQGLLKHLKSQRIVKNMEIFNKLKRKQQHLEHQQFPFEILKKYNGNFPCQNNKIMKKSLRNEFKYGQKLKFPLRSKPRKCSFLYADKGFQEKDYTNSKILQLDFKFKQNLKIKHNIRKVEQKKDFQKFPLTKIYKFNKEFPLQLKRHEIELLKFPLKINEYKGQFPCEKIIPKETNLKLNQIRIKTLYQNKEILKTSNTLRQYNEKCLIKFPNKIDMKDRACISTFPLQNPEITKENSLNNYLNNNYNKINNSDPSKTSSSSTCSTSLSMTQNVQKFQNIDNECMSQVQDAQVHVEENPLTTPTTSPLKINENKQPTPPQTTTTTTTKYDDADVYILAAINSINNSRPNEVGYYAEKIERIQDAIVVLFEKIQNSLTTNHNSPKESTNATHRKDVQDHDANTRFALTPPTTVTSVRNSESINDDEEVLLTKYDLGDLCDREVGQIVERSDVRDTLAKAVVHSVSKAQTNNSSTGSFLVKSEEPTSPYSPTPKTLNESILNTTSLEDYTNSSELVLPKKYNVLAAALNTEINVKVKNKLEFDPIETINVQNRLNELNEVLRDTPTNTLTTNNNLTSVKVNEMTVTRLADNEQDCANKDLLQTHEALEQKNNILSNDLQIDEMKFEMNRVKGALPTTTSSDRSIGKHENLPTAVNSVSTNYAGRHIGSNLGRLTNDSTLNNSRLPSSLSSSRNYNSDSSYTPRSSALKTDNSASKRSSISSHLPPEAIANRSVLNTPSISETISNRSALRRNSNDSTAEVVSTRRPSLGALRNTQSTSLLSVDLARYTPLNTSNQTEQPSAVSRAVSIDSSLEDVLPERTRLRRQRRLRTQDSQDEAEDPIERLNRLKARISASLSEVKGVLKQYSTDNENDNETQTQTPAVANNLKESKEEPKKEEAPVTFRFVKKVRRRSLFTEEKEKEEKEREKANEKLLESKDETDNINRKIETKLPALNSEVIKEELKSKCEKQEENHIENKEVIKTKDQVQTSTTEINKNLYTLKEEQQESLEDIKATENKTEAKDHIKIAQQNGESQDKIEIKIEESTEDDKNHKEDVPTVKEETKGAIPKPPVKKEADHEAPTKTKKKVIIKTKDPARRASLAAVEGSKIEPPVKLAIPAKIHRRPSDSEAMVKKKLITAKINTSGIVEEVTPKPKIVKVKKSSIKSNNNSQLATTQSKQKEQEKNDKSDDLVKSIDEDNKSIHTDKNKDVLMPKPLQQQQQQQQQLQQINNEITSQRNLLLPTQLVIDEAASLNVKTIENSVPPPRQEQQQQQLQQEKQATIKSTTTNFKSNDLQAAGGAMLENATTVLSSSKTSEANGQLKRENVVQPDDLRDLLQQETTIIKTSTIKEEQTNHETKIKQLSIKETEKSKDNLEITQTEKVEQKPIITQQQQHQQVVATTDVVIVKSEEDNNKQNDDVKVSLKEPCIDKTPTSTHIAVEQQQQQQGERSITKVADTKTISSPHNSISSSTDLTPKTTTSSNEQKTAVPAPQPNTMPEQQLAPAPVQTAEIIAHPEQHKKKVILKKIVRQASVDKTQKADLEITKPAQEVEKDTETITDAAVLEPAKDELTEECSESTEISESSNSLGSEEAAATEKPKKERKVKQKVIIKRQKRRLSIGDNFFHPGATEEPQNTEIETLEKPISYVTDEDDSITDESENTKSEQEQEDEIKPLKSCIMHKEYHIGDEVLYAERFKKTQIKWRRGRIKERITSISYLLDIDGKDVSSHINYLKKFTGRKVSFGGKEYLEIDYEQLAEEEEKAERLQRRTYSIWNMV